MSFKIEGLLIGLMITLAGISGFCFAMYCITSHFELVSKVM